MLTEDQARAILDAFPTPWARRKLTQRVHERIQAAADWLIQAGRATDADAADCIIAIIKHIDEAVPGKLREMRPAELMEIIAAGELNPWLLGQMRLMASPRSRRRLRAV